MATFGHFFFSGSVSLVRVTPLYLAVTGFRELCNIFDINTERDGYLRSTKKIAERVFVSEVLSHSREYDMIAQTRR